jgi:putative transposase
MSDFLDIDAQHQSAIIGGLAKENDLLVSVVAYCIMPTHIHLLLKQIREKGIEKYMGKVLNAFSRYFNEKHHRRGPLWTGRFNNVLVNTDEQLLHLTRYIHLNPVSAGLIGKPEEWQHSSYSEYTDESSNTNLCNFNTVINMDQKQYKKFVNDGKDYQKSLALIKNTLIDDYTG